MAILMAFATVYFACISIILMWSGDTFLAIVDVVAAGIMFSSAAYYKRKWDDEKKKR